MRFPLTDTVQGSREPLGMSLGQDKYILGVPTSVLNIELKAKGEDEGAGLLQDDMEVAWWQLALQCDFLSSASTYWVPAACLGPCWLLGIQGEYMLLPPCIQGVWWVSGQ